MALRIDGCKALLRLITEPPIVAKAEKLRLVLGLPSNAIKFSDCWVDGFKRCHVLQQYQSHGDASSVNLTSVKEEHMRMRHGLQGWDLNNVFNANEICFCFWKSIRNNGLLTKG